MVANVKVESASQSLPRLLSLDKSFDSLNQRLEEAARIIGLQLPDQLDIEIILIEQSPPTTTKVTHTARHEFVLRWLLDKLRKEPGARKSRQAWSTLYQLLLHLPIPTIAKATSGSALLSTIVTTLTDVYSPGHPISPTTSANADSDKSTKKRKRSSLANDTATSDILTELDTADRRAIFLTITALLRLLLDLVHHPDSALHPSIHNQLRSLLTLDDATSATLLSHWLTASLDFASSTGDAALLSIALHLVQDLLAIQSISQNSIPEQSFEHFFSLTCLSPAALLLAHLKESLLASPKHATLVSSIQVLDRLLAQHLFVPARATHHANLLNGPSTTVKPSSRRYNASLDDRLKSLHRAVIQQSTKEVPASPQQIAYKKALPYLLDIALRCTPTSTPKQRIAEASWFDALFTTMSSILALDPDNDSAQALAAMLAVLQTNNLRLSKALLAHLVRTWSGLEQESLRDLDQPDFQLVAAILAMDPTLFTDIKTPHTLALFAALSDYGEDISAEAPPTSEQRAFLCDKIAIPLMNAFAKIRSLRIYLDQWYAQLQEVSSHDQPRWSVWTAGTLHTSLESVLEPSLNITQIADLLQTHREILDQTIEDGMATPDAITQATASAIILNAAVDSLHSDASIDALQNAFESLIQSAQNAIGRVGADDEALTVPLLQLLCRVYLLWFPVWSASASMQNIEACLDQVLASPAMEKSLVTLEECEITAHPRQALPDASFELLATICDLMRRLPDQADNVKTLISAALLSRDGGPAALVTKLVFTVFVVITDRPCLLEYMSQIARQSIFQAVLPLASFPGPNQLLAEAFVDSVFAATNHVVRDDLFAMLTAQHSLATDQAAAMDLVLRLSSRGLPRQQREKVLDITTDRLLRGKYDEDEIEPILAVIMSLAEAPSATAKISSDAAILWKLALTLDNEECPLSTLDIFAEICSLLLKHILDTKEQERSKLFLGGLSGTLAAFMQSKDDILASQGQLRLLTVFVTATEARLEADALSKLLHRSAGAVDDLVKNLYHALSDKLDTDDIARMPTMAIVDAVSVMRAHSELPASFLSSGGSSTAKYTKRLEKLLQTVVSRISADDSRPQLIDNSPWFEIMEVQCFKKLASATDGNDLQKLCSTAQLLLKQNLDAEEHRSVLQSLSASAAADTTSTTSSLLEKLLCPSDQVSVVETQTVSVARCLIMSFKDAHKETSNHVSILPNLLALLSTCDNFEAHCELVSCIVLILRSKPFLVTQHTVEATIATAVTLLSPSSPTLPASKSHVIFSNLCDIAQALLQFHRPSLSGRHHILIPFLQRLLSHLFIPASRDAGSAYRFKHAAWLDTKAGPLTTTHGQRVSRLMENLCNPPHSDRTRNQAVSRTDGHDLVDLARKAKVQVGQHVQHVLHYFCTLILNGRLGEGVRDSLQPGLWAIMDVMEIGADEQRGVKSLSASMSNAERAVLRGIWEDWRRFGGWSG